MFNASSSRSLVSVIRRQASASSVPFALCVPLWPLFFSFVSLSATAAAQTTDTIGVRAQGMAGAFTAVADDATAGWWNPAGLAGGALFNGLIEYGRPEKAQPESVRGFAAAYPALGLTYYRLPLSQIRVTTSTGLPPIGRQEESVLSLYGATVGHSLGDHFVLGTTLKLLHADTTNVSLDVGAMASFGPARFGLTVRDLAEPAFGSGDRAFTLGRHARAGFALSSGRRGVVGLATVAVDADLMTTRSVDGEERMLAAGVEAWTPRRTFGIRGGLSKNTVGTEAWQQSGGVSVLVRSGTYADAYLSGGSDEARHGWGIALRVTF